MTEKFYIHRTRPGLLVQDLEIYNPTGKHLPVNVNQDRITSWASEHRQVNMYVEAIIRHDVDVTKTTPNGSPRETLS